MLRCRVAHEDVLLLRRCKLLVWLLVFKDELLLLFDLWNVLHKMLTFLEMRQEQFLFRRCLRWSQVIQLHCIVDRIKFHQQLLGLRLLLLAIITAVVIASHEIIQRQINLVSDLLQLCKEKEGN